jgi:hypothetical protein
MLTKPSRVRLRDVPALERAGALESVKIGRDRLFLNTGYLAALTAS